MSLGENFSSVLEAARIGAQWAVSKLYEDLQPRVLGYLRSREPNEAEDLASEAWIDVAQGLSRFQGDEADFRRFVFTIARRRLIDHRRRVSTRRTDPVPAELLTDLPTSRDVESDVFANMSAEEAVATITSSLPADQAEVVLLRVLGGFSASEVAEIMGKRPGTVRVLQHRALARLAEAIAQDAVTKPWREAM
jgi:RNA polymerase sigma-70 factor (ECF subfamily)